MRLNKLKEAEQLLLQLQKRRYQKSGGSRSAILMHTSDLGLVYFHQSRFAEAATLQLKIIERSHQDTRVALTGTARLADIRTAQARWNEAEQLRLQVISFSKQIYGDEHLAKLRSIQDLVTTYSCQGQWNAAKNLQVDVLNKMSEILGEVHPNTLNSIETLANILIHQGQHQDAKEYKDRAVLVQRDRHRRQEDQGDEAQIAPYPRSAITGVLEYDRSALEVPIEKPSHFSPYD